MSEIVSIAACFPHDPRDGQTIPASVKRPDPACPWEVVVDPIVGYMATRFCGRTRWSFIKYEAPDSRFLTHDAKEPVMNLGRMGTTRVGHVKCPSCSRETVYPVWGKVEKMRCPWCAKKGVSVTYISETSDEFFAMMGSDVRNDLEKALEAVPMEEFRFPNLFLLGKLEADPSVPEALQAKAAERGLALRNALNTSLADMFGQPMKGPGTGLLIEPGVVSGILDASEAREGWKRTSGVMTWSVKLPWIPEIKVRETYGDARL